MTRSLLSYAALLLLPFLLIDPAHAQWTDLGATLSSEDAVQLTRGGGSKGIILNLEANPASANAPWLFWDARASGNQFVVGMRQRGDQFELARYTGFYDNKRSIFRADLTTSYLGVGALTPEAQLDVHNPINAEGEHGLIARATYGSGDTYIARFDYRDSGSQYHETRMVVRTDGNVGIGTTSPSEKLSVNGKVRSKEVIVENSNWPDFVFEPGYDLRSLDAVDAFVDANGHLPGVPNASDVAQSGQHVGATQATLLQKIEELTLYTLQQKEQIEAQRETIETLRDRHAQQIESLRQQIEVLQKHVERE